MVFLKIKKIAIVFILAGFFLFLLYSFCGDFLHTHPNDAESHENCPVCAWNLSPPEEAAQLFIFLIFIVCIFQQLLEKQDKPFFLIILSFFSRPPPVRCHHPA